MPFQWPGEKLVEKMWDTLAEKGVGGLLKPWQTVRVGNAQTEVRRRELLALAQAEADAAEIKAGKKRLQQNGTLLTVTGNNGANALLLLNSDGRAEPAFDIDQLLLNVTAANVADHVRSEVNVAKTVIMAEEILRQETQDPPQETIEDDWLSTWREHVGKVSSEQLQRLWASVLAGEVKAPGTYSLRTLEFLRTLSKTEAEKISKIAAFVLSGNTISREVNWILEKNGITFAVLMEMQELGILSGVEAVGLTINFTSVFTDRFAQAIQSHGKALLVEKGGQPELKMQVYVLTNLGKQVMSLGSFSPNTEYLITVGKTIASKGFNVHLADILSTEKNLTHYGNGVPITAD
jgi:hypothetical protein